MSATDERRAIVAWLRAQVNYFSNRHAQDLADKIEAGEHTPDPSGDGYPNGPPLGPEDGPFGPGC